MAKELVSPLQINLILKIKLSWYNDTNSKRKILLTTCVSPTARAIYIIWNLFIVSENGCVWHENKSHCRWKNTNTFASFGCFPWPTFLHACTYLYIANEILLPGHRNFHTQKGRRRLFEERWLRSWRSSKNFLKTWLLSIQLLTFFVTFCWSLV